MASRACYRGLLRVLRSHPSVPVNIHVSGTLVHALQWLDPEPLQLIWEGLRAGQFELLGSTYAQNVTYASDDWDNQRQVEMHQELLHEVFGVTPVTFWNPERTWRQSLLPIIAGAGYRFTLLEDHILANAQLAEPVVVTSQVGAHILTLLYDDHLLRHMFNFAVWFGRPRQLQSYLLQRADHPNAGQHCLTYAADAAAMGLWGWQEGVVPNQTWHRLDQVLTLLEALPEIELIHLTNAPPSAGNLSPVPDGSAQWMDRALEDPDQPCHEAGYSDWFDFNENSPKLAHFRNVFGEVRAALKSLEEQVVALEEELAKREKDGKRRVGARVIYEAALSNYLSHQYEFACVGIGGKGYRGWEGVRASWSIIEAAKQALMAQPLIAEKDVMNEERTGVVLSDGSDFIVTSPAGGRLLYWFDLHTGEQYVGNQQAVPDAPFEGDAQLPEPDPEPFAYWFPEDYRPQAIVPEARLTAEAAPTRLGQYLPDWIWDGEREPFELLTREMRAENGHQPLPAQRRGFVDYVDFAGQDSFEAGAWLTVDQKDDQVLYSRRLSDEVSLQKQYSLADGEVVVAYEWINEGASEVDVTWQVLTELTPNYATLLMKGREALQFVKDPVSPGVRNVASEEEVRIVPDRMPDNVTYQKALLALEVGLTFRLRLPPEADERVTIRLRRTNVVQQDDN
jgi:hypothetical protein